jgi:hypothetical protein
MEFGLECTGYEVIERVEKRRVYFHIFYEGCKMGEMNEVSLICFWILKLMPFYSSKMSNLELNAKIAVHIFTNMLAFVQKRMNKKANINKQLLNDLYYAFRYRDLSKEAIMLIAEGLLHTRS